MCNRGIFLSVESRWYMATSIPTEAIGISVMILATNFFSRRSCSMGSSLWFEIMVKFLGFLLHVFNHLFVLNIHAHNFITVLQSRAKSHCSITLLAPQLQTPSYYNLWNVLLLPTFTFSIFVISLLSWIKIDQFCLKIQLLLHRWILCCGLILDWVHLPISHFCIFYFYPLKC